MPLVEETLLARLRRRSMHAVRVATHPSLMREQWEYMRHGPSEADAPAPGAPLGRSPWAIAARRPAAPAWCNVCGWSGDAFEGDRHVEGQLCPRCASNARDRFLFHCFVSRTPPQRNLRVLETSPRMPSLYRAAMAAWFTYTATDFDQSAHRTSRRLDLQEPDLPPHSVDVLLSAHVLEHVPDTDRALDGVARLLAPGGRFYLQVPVLDGVTAPPSHPEFHQDNTPVFWRFGFDLADRLRNHGFATNVLCTEPFASAVRCGDAAPLGPTNPQWDVPAMLTAAAGVTPVAVLDGAGAQQLGVWGSEQFVTFEGVVASGSNRERVRLMMARTMARLSRRLAA
jgi:SAM-dependent methyltransferase